MIQRMSKLKYYSKILRQKPTEAELKFKNILRSLDIYYHYQCIFTFGKYSCIVDFFIPKLGLVIEIDGGYHSSPRQIEKDASRLINLSEHGLKLLRFTNEEVISDEEYIFYKLKANGVDDGCSFKVMFGVDRDIYDNEFKSVCNSV